jgi:hypothetical protein
MLPAIDFDHQLRPVTGEVDDEVTDRDLPSPAHFGHDLA